MKIDALEEDLKNYLIYEKNYKETDIASIKGKKSKMPKYVMFVVFTDEPGITFEYTDRGIGQWIQIGPSDGDILRGIKYNHLEEGRKYMQQ
ncbi:hypothetical protein D3C84_1046130 [compost metagenome]